MTSQVAKTSTPEVEDRVLSICDPSMLTESELPTQPLDSWWYRADWEGIAWEVNRGRVIVISVESGEVESVKTCALYMGVDLLWKHDVGKGRLYLMQAPRGELAPLKGDDCGVSMRDNPAANKALTDLAADSLTLLYQAPTETINAVVRVLALGRDIELPDADERDELLDLARDILPELPLNDLLSIKQSLQRAAENERDADAA